ncbi:peptidylprolyl isomerase [Pelagibaculum spongiae]
MANTQVLMKTNQGDVTLQLFDDKAPKTVKNFLDYVKAGYYEGTVFHRVIPGFMIQGGGFDAKLAKKETRPAVENEADNRISNKRGTIAMARTNDPHSATSQFFINQANNSNLNFREKTARAWGYTVFGRVIKGMSTVDTIAQLPTGAGGRFRKDVPRKPVIIEKIIIIETSK